MIATMKPLKVKNVEVGPWGAGEEGTVGLGCEFEGARYHIWLNHTTLNPGDVVYKNPLTEDRKDPAHFRTRRLRTSSQWSRRLIASMLEIYKDKNLLESFEAQEAKADADREAKNAAADKLERIHNAAPDMHRIVSVLEKWFQHADSVSGSALVFGDSDQTLRQALQAVAKKLK